MTYPLGDNASATWPHRWDPPSLDSLVPMVLAALVPDAPGHDAALDELYEGTGGVLPPGEDPAGDHTIVEFVRQVTAAQVLVWELWTLQRAQVAPADLFSSRESISRVRAVIFADVDAAEARDLASLGGLARAAAAALFGTDVEVDDAIGRLTSVYQPLIAECEPAAAALMGPWTAQATLAPEAVGKRYYLPSGTFFDVGAALGRPGQGVDYDSAIARANELITARITEMVRSYGFDVVDRPLSEAERSDLDSKLRMLREVEPQFFGAVVMSVAAADDQWRIDGRAVGEEVAALLLTQKAMTVLEAASSAPSARAIMTFPQGDLISQNMS